MKIKTFTDGSCHTQLKIGAWASIVFMDDQEVELIGNEKDTTHNAMELTAVIKALDFVVNKQKSFSEIEIVSDSQYVVGIVDRKEKLKQANFFTKKNNPIRNAELVKQLISYIETIPLIFTKVKAHQKKTDQINYNRVVDKMARKEIRRLVELIS